MELEDRYSVEAANATMLAQLFVDQRRRIEADLRESTTADGIPESEWDRQREETAALLLLILLGVYMQTAEQVNRQEGFGIPETQLQRQAREWAQETADRWAEQIVADTRERVELWIDSLDPGVRPSDMFADLVVIYGPSRIENVAITETTRGQTAGVRGTYNFAAGMLDAIVILYWQTERDDRVCPICRPLDGVPEAEWPEELRDGPPAHPRCRCDLRANFEYRKF